jgi:NTP pyrophosphatase (non-canonical NTP hydrolase)
MDLNTYVEEVSRTRPDLGSAQTNQIHMAMGIATEAGEILDAYKKNLAYGRELDLVNVREEIGDLMWYIANLCTLTGIDLETALDINIAKLRLRYPSGFTQSNAITRNLELERALLEQQ